MAHAPAGRTRIVTGLFREKDSAERAYRSAIELGYQESDVNVILSDETRERFFPTGRGANVQPSNQTNLADKAAQSTEQPLKADELGGPVGGTVGTIAPVLAAVGTLLLIPGIVIAGPVAVALTAAGAVGVAGGLVGALTNWGIPKERVQQYEEDVRRGGILMGVQPRSDEDAEQLRREWRANGGEIVQ